MADDHIKHQRPLKRQRVLVVGAGAAGIVAAREALREGHHVTIYEKGSDIGGIWLYNEQTEEDELGLDPNRQRIHSSTYADLRTNLPRALMSYSDFPFTVEAMGTMSVDPRRFPRHEEVLQYLKCFATEFDVDKLVKLNTRVESVVPVPAPAGALGPQWKVTSFTGSTGSLSQVQDTQVFDAVISAVGNYHEPNLPAIPGIRSFPGAQLHCHNYRTRHRFRGQKVLVIGASFSGNEIAFQIASVAHQVVQCARTWTHTSDTQLPANVSRHDMPTSLSSDGWAQFGDGHRWKPDAIVYCTGYQYAYPWLPEGILDIEDFRVGHLYNHIFHPDFAPTLAFVGLIVRSTRNPQFELQGKFVARCLSGCIQLPTQSEMWADIDDYYSRMKAAGVPMRYTHSQGLGHSPDSNAEYNDKLARACGPDVPCYPAWRVRLHQASSAALQGRIDTFRDQFTAEENQVYAEAMQECAKLLHQHRLDRQLPKSAL